MFNINRFSISLNGTRHQALVVLPKRTIAKSSFLFIHGAGAGNSSKEKVLAFSDDLTRQDVSIFAMDHSGAGEDAPNIKKSSLKKRLEEALEAIGQYFSQEEPITICASSMGGHIAIRLLEHVQVKNLILLAPAIYNRRAFDVPFGDGFTEIIREPESWRDSETLAILEKFRGRMLIVYGTKDEVIPRGVIDLLDRHSPGITEKEILLIKDSTHALFGWMKSDPAVARRISQKVTEFSL